MKTTQRRLTFQNQVALGLFLELWHDGKTARAKAMAVHFADGSREKAAALFLLDPRQLDKKKADFQEKLAADQPSFWDFIVAEYHLKNNNRLAAIQAYKQCISQAQESSELDDWFVNRSKRELGELAEENIPIEAGPGVDGRE